MPKLSDKVRPNCEAAPWVIEEIKKLEAALEKIDILAEAGLCYFTLASAREYLKDVRDEVSQALKTVKPERK